VKRLAYGLLLLVKMDVLCKEPVSFRSLGETIAGMLFLPSTLSSFPALVICHGAGEFKENFFPFCEFLAERGIATLAIDMHGHGESEGERYFVNIQQWMSDVRAAVDFLSAHPSIDDARIGALGISSGGTAILEAALVDPRLKALIALDATVRNSLDLPSCCIMKLLHFVGHIKKALTGRDLRVPVAKLSGGVPFASDPDIDKKIQQDPRVLQALGAFPFPGASQAFFVDTLKRVSRIGAPTLVLWGEDDKLDPPETARLLFEQLSCQKKLEIIPGNGHAGHLDRNRLVVFALTAGWALEHLT
jgi:alpha-beta hydrolase superfamily lysophospholipase